MPMSQLLPTVLSGEEAQKEEGRKLAVDKLKNPSHGKDIVTRGEDHAKL